MGDWTTNPASTDDERRLIRLMRYAVREEVARLAVIAFLFWLLFRAIQ